MKYKIALFGEMMDKEWNPMECSLYEHIKNNLKHKRKWNELDAIFDKKTGFVHVSLKGGFGG